MGDRDLLSIKETAERIGKSKKNVRYLIERGYINRYGSDGSVLEDSKRGQDIRISKGEVEEYMRGRREEVEAQREDILGEYNQELAFDKLSEKESTKHVHRLHPYKGKFIPQLVEYFLESEFEPGDTIIDPFVGSGTTLVQAKEMGIDSVGVDISPFNCTISDVKTRRYNLTQLEREVNNILKRVEAFSGAYFDDKYQRNLKDIISEFNQEVMPEIAGEYECENHRKEVAEERFRGFLDEVEEDLNRLTGAEQRPLAEDMMNPEEYGTKNEYLNTWFSERSIKELMYYKSLIPEYDYQDVLRVILTRSARSSRMVPHYDLTNPDEPVEHPYYCYKHKKVCTPIRKAAGRIRRYSKDTVRRVREYDDLRTDSDAHVVQADARIVDLNQRLDTEVEADGVFTSPPYVGVIDYHEQHRYAYELLDTERHDKKELGSKSRGKSKEARQEYSEGIASVFRNLRDYIKEGAQVLVVANDKHNLYENIAGMAGMEITEEYSRPVSRRSSRDTKQYSEKVFQMVYV